ncbi:hypothetical protein [Microvirga mediterraneensis]|uniref:Uncharacterized protein n=1 Tax=Microvirga mediterraneensis TaxID=2754695 RepID=A0A838BPY1_9HYPH|nr:hypothetical protein [Microvirga mediterraneensis]MBA1156893.1 hypothetical protein [Microvirga mediterraneensis]MBA1157804.1 hypothetical protein [Microvirga mediterraneensis]
MITVQDRYAQEWRPGSWRKQGVDWSWRRGTLGGSRWRMRLDGVTVGSVWPSGAGWRAFGGIGSTAKSLGVYDDLERAKTIVEAWTRGVEQ